MPNPIVIVYLPKERGMSSAPGYAICGEIQERFERIMPDYYWFVLPDTNIERVELSVFYEKDFTEIQYRELHQLIKDKIKEYGKENPLRFRGEGEAPNRGE